MGSTRGHGLRGGAVCREFNENMSLEKKPQLGVFFRTGIYKQT